MVGRAGSAMPRRQRPRLPAARGRRADAELGDVGPDLQAVRLAAGVRRKHVVASLTYADAAPM
jgi:hypothetical protein